MAECVKYHPKGKGVEPSIECKKKFHLGGLAKERNSCGKAQIDKIIDNKIASWGPWDPEWLVAPNSRNSSSNKLCPYKNIEIKSDQHITNNSIKRGQSYSARCDLCTKTTPVGSTTSLVPNAKQRSRRNTNQA